MNEKNRKKDYEYTHSSSFPIISSFVIWRWRLATMKMVACWCILCSRHFRLFFLWFRFHFFCFVLIVQQMLMNICNFVASIHILAVYFFSSLFWTFSCFYTYCILFIEDAHRDCYIFCSFHFSTSSSFFFCFSV